MKTLNTHIITTPTPPASSANHGWKVSNGSGWNNHRTAAVLSDRRTFPRVPHGYAVVCGPISDKPLGLRCALVRELPRCEMPSINYHTLGGSYLNAGAELSALIGGEPDDMTPDDARDYLAGVGFSATSERPAGWPEGREWFTAPGGGWASLGMLDDGPVGEADGWARDQFAIDCEIVKSVRECQQANDSSGFFLESMRAAIASL